MKAGVLAVGVLLTFAFLCQWTTKGEFLTGSGATLRPTIVKERRTAIRKRCTRLNGRLSVRFGVSLLT